MNSYLIMRRPLPAVSKTFQRFKTVESSGEQVSPKQQGLDFAVRFTTSFD